MLAFVEKHVLGLDVYRIHQLPALYVILADPVAHGAAVYVVLNSAHHPVASLVWGGLGLVQFVHLQALEFERDHAAGGVAVQDDHAAVHLFPLHHHPQNFIERLFPGHVAVAGLAPAFPRGFNPLVQAVVPSHGPQGVTLSHHVTLVGVEDGLGNIAVALQVPRPCPHHVPAVPVRGFRALIVDAPPGIDPAKTCGVIPSQAVQPLPPQFPLVGPARGHGGDHIVKPAHADHLPSKNAT